MSIFGNLSGVFTAVFSSGTSISRGVAVLFKNSFSFEIVQTILDPQGNYIILDIKAINQQFTLCALYGPNEDSPKFFENISNSITNINNVSIIMAGDWNVVLDYEKDTLNCKHKNNPKSQKCIYDIQSRFNLVDVWRKKHENLNRYTWTGPNNKHARSDYFLTSSDLVNYIDKTDIGIRYKSDHNPVSITLKFVEQESGRGNWKFNDSLLGDIEYVSLIKLCVTEIINQYKINLMDQENPELDLVQFSINDQLFWETLKLGMRGKTISYASYKKRSQNRREIQIEEQLKYLSQNFDINKLEIDRLNSELARIREDRVQSILLTAKVRWKVKG